MNAAPLSRPTTSKKPIKRTATPSMSQSQRGKRPRPSFGDDPILEPLKKKEPSSSSSTSANGQTMGLAGVEGTAMRKGMYLAFIDDAFGKRSKGNNERYLELISQFKSLLPSSTLPIKASSESTSSTTSAAPTSAQIRIWLDALTHVVSRLDKTHAPLVETILAIPWACMEEGFVAAYVRFIAALVSARAEWLKAVLEKCVKGFKYRSNYTASSSSAQPSITRRIVYSRLHTLLRLLLSLIPTLSPALSPLLSQQFPSKREPVVAQICYINNLLAVSLYCSGLAEDILGVIVERALNLDVEIQGEPEEWEDVEDDMEEIGGKVAGIADIVDRPTGEDESSDDDDDGSDDGGGLDLEESDDEPDPVGDEEAAKLRSVPGKKMSTASIKRILENRSKLDSILKVLFDHLAAVHSGRLLSTPTNSFNGDVGTTTPTETTPTPESPASPELIASRLSVFRTLLDIFDRLLLRTFKTRNTQFLLFYLCSLEHSSSDHFVGVLLDRALFQIDVPAVTRVAAAGYVASYISRAKFVDAGMTRKVVKHLCIFLEAEIDEASLAGGGTAQHLPVIYAVAQALFYIFCFRWKDLLDEGDDDEIGLVDSGRRWMLGLETVKKAVGSSFNPLKVCAQTVVNQFASIAHKTNFLYCYAIIESNRRMQSSRDSFPVPTPSSTSSMPSAPLRSISDSLLRPPSTPTTSNAPRQLLVAEEMDSFFPFDPFKLPLSSVYIDDIYREWVPDDESETEGSDDTSDTSDDTSDDDDDDSSIGDGDMSMQSNPGGLAVPGANWDTEADDDVSRSFEAMSLSPERGAFGGRGAVRPLVL